MQIKNGLPDQVEFCKKCNISNQQPTTLNEYFHVKESIYKTVKFTDGVCAACIFNDKKWDGEIDWAEREKELIELCNKYRKNNGEYDCIVGGSGGKDSVFQSWMLKYKYKMNPLTVTWSPHLYTNVGWNNFQKWLHKGGFDNYLYTPNGKIHRILTKQATKNLLHPFQPFILGQKTFVVKMACNFNIPLIFYGEMPGEYGRNVSHKQKKFDIDSKNSTQIGYQLDLLEGKDFKDSYLGGKKVRDYLDEGISLADLQSYMPADPDIIQKKDVQFYFLGYFLRWVPQENYYFAVDKISFEQNEERTEGTYSKYNSIDDKLDGFFYYTRYVKFGVGRAMMDSAQEIRNGHITKDEGLALIKKFDGEYPAKFEEIFYNYIDMDKDEFLEICDEFRKAHIWEKRSNRWVLKKNPS
ncbi:N-acetyl sugar amidotransferase [Candidatus Pelagibacter sp.]|nr:N-acetyl sugar amidotransferase [Candidatus Pelagibacter sp.]